MNFDFWQRWGLDLDDVSFANAWIAVGLADGLEKERSVDALGRNVWSASSATWRFPSARIPIHGMPADWAQAWKRLPAGMRLRVKNPSPDEPLRPWYRMLGEANPAPAAVSLAIEAPRAQLQLNWPLRVGCLAGGSCDALETIERQELGLLHEVTQTVRIDRDHARCDFLIYSGPVRSLLQELLGLSWSVKANVLVLSGGDEASWGEMQNLLAAALSQTRASGFVLLPARLGTTRVAELFGALARELSHGKPMDAALSSCIRGSDAADTVAGFTDELAAFDVRRIVIRFQARLSSLPRGTAIDLSHVGPAQEWLARGLEARGLRGGTPKKSLAAPDADRRIPSETVALRPDELLSSEESQGGATLAQLGRALPAAQPPAPAAAARTARFLQQHSFVQQGGVIFPAAEGFIAGTHALVRVRIGRPEEGWNTNAGAPIDDKLPPTEEGWTLTIWLSEPRHIPTPLKRKVELPLDGNSTECEFQFKPKTLAQFEGQLTVLHRGRVIQTASLRAAVLKPGTHGEVSGAPHFESETIVRHGLGNLDGRSEYDLSFVASHDSRGRPYLTAVSANAAWMKDLSRIPALASEINRTLSDVALSVEKYKEGLDGKEGEKLFVQLAQHGGVLKAFLHEALDDPANNPAAAAAEYVQVVSTRADTVVPLEFVYDYTVPEDGAKVCRRWRDALEGKCPKNCKLASQHRVCPLGFWGLSKVIERHAVRPGLEKDGNVLFLQSETRANRDTLYLGGVSVLGGSQRIPTASINGLKTLIAEHCGAEPKVAKGWDDWEKIVKSVHPSLLVALVHTDGSKTNVTVEIDGNRMKTVTLRDTHVFPPPREDGRQAPLVALIGCDTTGTADDYGNHVLFFRDHGAGIVIGTIATVFGEHACSVAGKLVEGMLPKGEAKPARLGELIRAVRRNSLRDGLLMPLCLVAYGDADWIVSSQPTPP
ncbi:hypothetical protein DB347_06420 [Opitutaceae bacterium EW11]|nr:hypothetical protein DB347_06420 [Opitutaceae bacterium EW11]